jgi:hypothetical protein
MSIWKGQGWKQGGRNTSEEMPLNLGVYTFMGGKRRAALGEVIREEFSGKGCLGELFCMTGAPLSSEETLIPSEIKKGLCSGETQLP